MKLLILRDSRIIAKAGEIVEVSPAEDNFLLSTGSAIPAEVHTGSMVKNPEKNAEAETPENGKKTARTARKK